MTCYHDVSRDCDQLLPWPQHVLELRPREKKPAFKKALNRVESFKLSWWLYRGLKQLSRLVLDFFPKIWRHWVANREGVARRNRADGWGAPSHFQRFTRYSNTRPQKQLRTAENARARAASVSVPYCDACRQSGPEASEKASLFGKWRWLGHAEEYGHMWCTCMCVMPFTGFSTSSTLTLWILSKHSKPQPVWCALPLLLYSTQHLHPFTCLNSCGHSPFLMRTSS